MIFILPVFSYVFYCYPVTTYTFLCKASNPKNTSSVNYFTYHDICKQFVPAHARHNAVSDLDPVQIVCNSAGSPKLISPKKFIYKKI